MMIHTHEHARTLRVCVCHDSVSSSLFETIKKAYVLPFGDNKENIFATYTMCHRALAAAFSEINVASVRKRGNALLYDS